MQRNKKIILIGFFVLILTCLGFLIGNPQKSDKEQSENCDIKTEERIVRGNSLSPLIEPGETVKVLFDYYNCHNVKREDIVSFNYSGNKDPIIKVVKGIPGDEFELKKNNSNWNILINGKILRNSESWPYLVSGNEYKMLSLYAKDYPVIPENTYLILGNLTSGSLDSTRFGLVSKSDILGKVEK